MGSADKDVVYKFMVTANRPFSGNDVFSSLQRQGVGKSAVEKALDQLAIENKIVMKLNGKQKIFCAVQQSDTSTADRNEIQTVDEELSRAGEALRDVERKYKQSETELKTLQGSYSVDEAKLKVIESEKTVSELKSQLEQLSKKTGNVSAEDKEQVKKDYEKFTKEYRKRKRMCTDILDSILENCPKTKKALFEEIGIETDESVDMPSL